MKYMKISHFLMIFMMLLAPWAVWSAPPASAPPTSKGATTTPPPSIPPAPSSTTPSSPSSTPSPAKSTTPTAPKSEKTTPPVKKTESAPSLKAEMDVPVDVEASGIVCQCTNDDLKNCTEGVGDYLCAPYYGAHCQKEIAACIKKFEAPRENLAQVCDCYKVLQQCGNTCNSASIPNTCSVPNAKPTLSPVTCRDYAISPCVVPTMGAGPSDSLCAACCTSAQNFDNVQATPPYWSCLANPRYNKTRHSFDSCVRAPFPPAASDE